MTGYFLLVFEIENNQYNQSSSSWTPHTKWSQLHLHTLAQTCIPTPHTLKHISRCVKSHPECVSSGTAAATSCQSRLQPCRSYLPSYSPRLSDSNWNRGARSGEKTTLWQLPMRTPGSPRPATEVLCCWLAWLTVPLLQSRVPVNMDRSLTSGHWEMSRQNRNNPTRRRPTWQRLVHLVARIELWLTLKTFRSLC